MEFKGKIVILFMRFNWKNARRDSRKKTVGWSNKITSMDEG